MGKRGFTLIEMMVVIAIIAVLAAVVAPQAFKAIDKAKYSGTIEDFNSIKTAAAAYYADLGSYPSSCATDALCTTQFCTGEGITGWDGPYLDKWPSGGRLSATSKYTFTNNTAGNGVEFGAAANETFITITNTTAAQLTKLDTSLDGNNGANAGNVQEGDTTATDLMYLIYRSAAIAD